MVKSCARFRPALAIGAALLAACLQLCWPAALSLHEHLAEHATAAHDSHDSHSHDASHCPTCQAIAHVRTLALPPVAPSVLSERVNVRVAVDRPATVHVAVELNSASPRAPPTI